MKSVTSTLLTGQKQPSAQAAKRLYYKRRYWTGSAYAWESNWTEYVQSKVVGASAINWQLDTDQLNEFKVSNITVTVDNSHNEFRADNLAGFFKPDTTSPTYGYEPYLTKWQVRAGFTFDDTEETVTLFTGVAVDYISDSQAKTCQVQIQGLETLLLNTKAESIATTVTNETPTGSVNGSNKDFVTLNPGVGDVTVVTVNGTTKVLGVDYTVSQTNDTTLGAKVSFTVAPSVGQTVEVTYYYWPQSKKFEELVALLVTAGGIASGSQQIDPVSFGNSVINTQPYASQADFNTWTLSNMETVRTPGRLDPDWHAAGFTAAQTWSAALTGWSQLGSASWTSNGTELVSGTAYDVIYRALARSQGSWQFSFKYDSVVSDSNGQLFVTPLCTAVGSTAVFGAANAIPGTFQLAIRADSATGKFFLLTAASGGTYGTGYNTGVTADTSYHTVRFVKSGETDFVHGFGTIYIYFDGTLVTSSSFGIGSSAASYFAMCRNSGSSLTIRVKDISVPPASTAISGTTPTLDLTAAPSSFLATVITYSAQTATATFETRTSTDGSTWDAWTALSGTLVPQSALKRYFQFRVTSTIDNSASNGQSVVVDDVTIQWLTSSTLVTLPAFDGLSAYEAIEALGEYTNYEFGFSASETFFFRQRTIGASVMTLTQSDFISRVSSMDSGYSRVYGIVRATYGAYVREKTDAGTTRTSPVARVGNARYEISPDSSIQIPATADIATGVAQTLFDYLSTPKRRCRVVTKFLPQLDLGDVVTLTLSNDWPPTVWYWGDPEVYWGDEDIYWWGAGHQFLDAADFRVIGARYDIDRFSCEFTLEEVVS